MLKSPITASKKEIHSDGCSSGFFVVEIKSCVLRLSSFSVASYVRSSILAFSNALQEPIDPENKKLKNWFQKNLDLNLNRLFKPFRKFKQFRQSKQLKKGNSPSYFTFMQL